MFGLLQTRAGQDWLAGIIARAASGPGFSLAIEGLRGTVPFRMTAARIEIGDRTGVWLTLRDVALDLAPADLLAGKVHVRSLTMAEIDVARAPSSSSAPAGSVHLPQLPVALAVDRLTITRLELAPAVLGESVVATIIGNAAIEGETARAILDLHRTDGFPGNIALQMALAGAHPALQLRLRANEPTGILADRWLGRTDRLPLALSVDGDGKLADWHGRLTASAGGLAHLDADIALAAGSETALGLSGQAALAPLLPAGLAPVVGDRATFLLRASFGKRIAINHLKIGIAAGTITGDSSFDAPDEAIAAHLAVHMPDLAPLSALTGAPLRGSATLQVAVTGSQTRPVAKADLSAAGIEVSGSAAERVEAHVSATPTGPLDNAATRIAVAANGRIEGLAVPEAASLAPGLGRGIDWTLAATADRDAGAVEVTHLSVQADGLALSGSGRLATVGQTVAGNLDFAGSASGARTGIAAVDALIGGKASFAGALRRDPAGLVTLGNLTLDGSAAKLSGNARFDPAAHLLTAAASLDVPRLQPLGAVLGGAIAGALTARAKLEGPLDRLRLQSEIEGRRITAVGVAIDRFRLTGEIADLSRPKAAIAGSFRLAALDGTVALAGELNGNSLVVPRLRITAADSTLDGDLRIALATGLAQGSLAARLPDLSRWSALAGRALGGSLDLNARLAAAGGGQGLDLSVNGARLSAGAGAGRIAIGSLGATARLADIWRRPSATGQLSLRAAQFAAGDFTRVAATVSSPRPGRFGFAGTADGRPLTVAFAGEGGFAPGGGELRLTRLAGTLGSDQYRLEQPLELTRRGADLAFSGLDLRLGAGRVTGGGAVKGEALSLALNAADLPVATAARLLGYPGEHGSLSLAASLGGTLRAPRGHLVANARELSLAVSRHARAPRLGLTVVGDWNGRSVEMQGRVTGLEGDRVAFTGSLPLLLIPAPLGFSVPPQGPLALRLQGSGDIGHLADLLPLGEDRLSGHFAADVAVGGTVASPAASGRLQLTGARYENFATGAVLTDIAAELVGDRDRFRLTTFSAGDGAGGKMTAQGSLVLSGPAGPTAELSAKLADFRVAARDEALVAASGTISVTGHLAAPRVVAVLSVDRAEINLPDNLPPSVVVLHVTEIGGKTAKLAEAVANPAPALPAVLDITLQMPGQVFVRGHGLNSDWHGRLKITGTSAAPQIAGVLVASRGNVDLLGKSFRLTRGAITFDGSARLDPALDIVAEASAADITAQVIISGFASAPKITLASTPPVPQDEILSRILFNQGVGQITAGQGLQLAQAAATLAGGGPGVLDRLRGKLGLDWLGFGQGPTGAASPILNPSVVTPTNSSATALSAGKYIMPGVSVGVTQGVSPPTSKVTVEIEVGHHVTVDTEAGQNGGTGIGINYKYDY